MYRASLTLFASATAAGAVAEQAGIARWALPLAALIALGAYRLTLVVRAGIPAALALGAMSAYFHTHNPPFTPVPRSVTLRGTVLAINAIGPRASAFVLRDEAGLRFDVRYGGEAPSIGSHLTLHGRIEAFDQARNPGEHAQAASAQEQGLDARVTRTRLLRIEAPDARDPHVWLPLTRAWASTQIRARMEEPYASILAGALWGERAALPPELRAEFQDTGTVHILVTAGLHLGVVAALCTAFLTFAGAGRIASSLAAIPMVWLYAAFSGTHLPSLRAAVMASFALLARAAGREALSWNALAAAAIVVVLVRPQSVPSISFALSFSCVGAIILFASPIATFLERFRIPRGVGEAAALTIATQIGTWPLTATAFFLFAPYAPPANALVVPVVGVVMLVGIAQLLLAPIGPAAQACANINTSLLIWIVGVTHTISAFPHAHVPMTPPPPWAIAIYDAALFGVAHLLAHEKKREAALVFIAACALIVRAPAYSDHDLIVTAIDVGQGDALLIETPNRHAFLVDAGGRIEHAAQKEDAFASQSVGERIVVPFLLRRGIRHLDAVLLSHPHGDHAGGLAPILHTLGADAFADSGQSYPGRAYHNALDAARAARIPLLEPRGGDVWRTEDGVLFRFYNPTAPYLLQTRNDINNNSLVFRLEYGRFAMLFTGDAGAEAEQRMLARGDDLRAPFLKVGHHGSAYSSTPEFLRAVAPRVAIISVGRDNPFGHPAERTLRALQAVGARIYRTDQNGAISIRSDGNGARVDPFLSPHSSARF